MLCVTYSAARVTRGPLSTRNTPRSMLGDGRLALRLCPFQQQEFFYISRHLVALAQHLVAVVDLLVAAVLAAEAGCRAGAAPALDARRKASFCPMLEATPAVAVAPTIALAPYISAYRMRAFHLV